LLTDFEASNYGGRLVKPLDPRKTPFSRGDVVTRGFKLAGLVTEVTSSYLEVRWNKEGNEGNDTIERIPAAEMDNLVRVAHADSLSAGGDQTNLQSLEGIEALERVTIAMRKRMATIKTPREKAEVDSLVTRAFAKDGCPWDRKNGARIFQLAVEPNNVGMLFKIQERLHRGFCKYEKIAR
jgi:hypothetical protein